MEMIETRQKKIADGLAAAAKSEKDLSEAEARSKEIIREARDRAAQIVDQAGKRSNEMVDEAKGTASTEAQRLLAQAHDEVARESSRAREGLRQEVGKLAVAGRVAPARARDRPEDSRRAAGQIGGRDRAWLSEPPSPGRTRKRRSSTRATRTPLRSGRRGSKSRPRSSPIRASQRSSRIRELTAADLAGLIGDVAGDKLDAGMQNFVRVLAENHRLLLLPEIAAHYEASALGVENTVDVEVISAVPLERRASRKARARRSSTRLKRQVRMQNSVDATLLGGAVIRAGDLVIDGSLKGRLERLANANLAS